MVTKQTARTSSRRGSVLLVLVLVILVGCSVLSTPVAAQTDTRTGGTITVEADETVDSLTAVGGTVIVEGTVTGDVSAAAGEVRIEGDVGGDLEAGAGSVTITGTVDGDVDAGAGGFELAEGATIGGDLTAGSGGATIDGTIEGDAEIGAETTRLGDEAAIEGDLRYGGDLEGNTDAVAGTIEYDSTLGNDFLPSFDPIGSLLVSAYVLALNLLFGAILLALFPLFSDRVAGRVAETPARSGLAGLGVLIGVPILLVALAITVIGIPLSIVGAFVFALLVWIGGIYGWFAVAAWLLSLAGIGNRWIALVVGLVGGALIAQIPWVGGPLNFIVLLLGLGALALALFGHRRAVRERERRRDRGPRADTRTDRDTRDSFDSDEPAAE
ncbi:polymer-forming cytoskeletal protein [Natrialba sp. PRR66]|uniref:bactofilin family protein n=1 Tax=Natrialba sp. PRR66 TaxID=3098146 RepID=UPI002B1D28B7|nr:polymer-forming cytoskeletal protein [Natrialba sp. PRR66]